MDDDTMGYSTVSPWLDGGNNQNHILVVDLWPLIQNTYEMTWFAWLQPAGMFLNTEEVQQLSFTYDYTNPRTGRVTTRTVTAKEYEMEMEFYAGKVETQILNEDGTYTIGWMNGYNKWLKDWGTND